MRFRATLIITSVILLVVLTGPTQAQECGPGCPACSGKATGDLLSPGTVLGSWLSIPDGEEETSVLKFRSGLVSWMDVGVGYAVDSEEPTWSVRVQPIAQELDGWRPALTLGTGSVQTGGSDQSIYLQVSKTREIVEGRLAISLAGGYATDLPGFEEEWGLGTVSLTLFDRVSPFYSYDGVNPHVGLSYFATEWLTLTGFYLEMEEFALSVGLQWDLCATEDEE